MKNRAKCKLCDDIIESAHSQDYQLCKCGEIFVDGGKDLKCGAKDWTNFRRIDDSDREIIPKIIEKSDISPGNVESEEVHSTYEPNPEQKHANLCSMLKGVIDSYDNLPQHAKLASITHYDLQAALLIIYEIVRK